jgi:preprotein translocase subunit SecG
MIVYILQALFLLSCVTMIIAVLLQPGKTDAGALFTSSISSTAFGARGTQTILSKITIGAAICFMLSALLLAMPAIRGNVSIMNSSSTTSTESTATPATDANANVSTNTETNANATNAATDANTVSNTATSTNATNSTANVANTANTKSANK